MKRKKRTIKMKNENKANKQQEQTKKAAKCDNLFLYQWWRCYQAIALNDKQIGPTSLFPLSSKLTDVLQ